MSVRTVGEGTFQQFALAKRMSEPSFEFGQVFLHTLATYRGDCVAPSAGSLLRPSRRDKRSCSVSASFCNSGLALANCRACSTELSAAVYLLRWSWASARWYQTKGSGRAAARSTA